MLVYGSVAEVRHDLETFKCALLMHVPLWRSYHTVNESDLWREKWGMEEVKNRQVPIKEDGDRGIF